MSDEAGFTLVEQLVAMVAGIIVLLAAYTVMETASGQQAKIANRAEAAQRGRQAMETMTQQLRSMLCLSSSTPPRAVVDGTGDQITFYADLSDGSTPPQRRQLTFDPVAGTFTERQYDGSSATPPAFGATPSRTRIVLDKVARLAGGPVFTYHAFSSPGVVDTAGLPVPLTPADAARTVDVTVSFLAAPTSGPVASGTSFTSDVFIRFANPATPTAPMPCT